MKADIWRPRFIQALRNSGNVRASCQAAGIDRSTVYKAREKSKEFAEAWDEALEEAVDTLEAAAWTRARDGVTRREPVMYKGEKVGEKVITEYSDQLMTLLLKAHRPDKYRERVDMKHSGKVEVEGLKEIALAQIAEWRKRQPDLPLETLLAWASEDFGIDKAELVSGAVN